MDSDDEEVPQLVEVEPAVAIPAVGYKISGQDIPVSYTPDCIYSRIITNVKTGEKSAYYHHHGISRQWQIVSFSDSVS